MLTSCFSFLVILCILVYFYLMLDLHIKNKGIYSPVRHAVSDYGVGEYKYLFNWAGIVSTFRNIFLIGALICWNYETAFKEKAIYWYWPWWAISELWFFQQILKEAAKQSAAACTCYLLFYSLPSWPFFFFN